VATSNQAETPGPSQPAGGQLTARERQILGLLAEGMSGAQIATQLFLSPETVRTHIRNAMARLGASTRSQAVALALEREEIAPTPAAQAEARSAGRRVRATMRAVDFGPPLAEMLSGLAALYDLDGGAVFRVDDDGMLLRRVAERRAEGANGFDLPESVALGEGPLGKVALERRSQLLGRADTDSPHGGMLAAPIVGGGRLLGLLALVIRTSRPTGRSELLLLQAFANRVGEILLSGDDLSRRLEQAIERFRTSWVAATRAS
jgi:DNA-binding CsgD family transcriptional regulator